MTDFTINEMRKIHYMRYYYKIKINVTIYRFLSSNIKRKFKIQFFKTEGKLWGKI